MSFRKLISSAAAAAIAASMLTIAPAANAADTDIWNYGFESSDIGGAITGYNEDLIVEDPSDAANHVYNLGTSQITKNVNDTVFTGTYKLSFDFECVSYESGQCAFYAYLYRNGADYKSADYLSLTANGALQFNGENVLQANGTSLYYLKGGRYHVDWVIDREAKHQTVTLTGLINSKENQTITVADADFADRNDISFEYTSGLQLKGGNLYIDNIIAAPYTSETVDTEPTEEAGEPETSSEPEDSDSIWSYGFEGNDIGGAITGYDENLIIEDPSDESNHVYNLGTTQLTKNVNDTVFTGTYNISFDFEYKQVYDSTAQTGDCTLSVYLYRSGSDYKAADLMSTTKNGALQFNGTNVLQANGTSLYYLKSGRYHVDWVIDREAKHQTVTLTGLINSKEGQTITVVDADFADRTDANGNNVPFTYTSGIQLKGGDLYIDNLIAAPYTEPEEEPTQEVPTESVPTDAPPTPTPIPDSVLWSYGFDDDANTAWTGYSDAQVAADADNGTKVFKLDSAVKQISKGGQTLLGEFTYSYDFKADALVSNQVAVDFIRNGASNTAETRDRLTFSNGKALFNGANPVNSCFIEAGKWYHVDWKVDGVNRQYTINVTGSVSSNNNDFEEKTIELGTFDIPANSETTDNTFAYINGIYMINNAADGGNVYIDNLTAEIAAPAVEIDGETPVALGTTEIKLKSNHFFKPDTGKVTVTKNGKALGGDAYSVTWQETRTDKDGNSYITTPVITFTEGLDAGSYTISFNGINTSYSKAVTLSASFKATAGNPLQGFAETELTVGDDTISGFINGYPASALTPIWKDGMTGTGIVKNLYGEEVTEGPVYDGYTYEVTSSDGGDFIYTFEAVTDIYSNSFNSDVKLSDGSSEITSANVGQRDKLFPAEDAVYAETDAKPVNSSGAEVSNWNQGLFQSVVVGDTGLALNREAAPYKTDRAIALKANEYAGEANIQVIKDFYADDEDYPVQISMSIMPDGNGDVSFGIKTSYYGESWQANIDATDGSGLNSIATPIAFMADKKIMCFGADSGYTYQPDNWYNASLVIDKVTVDGVTTKKACAYLNGEKIGEYDWSAIAAQIEGNEGFYSLTMRENYKTAAGAVTSKTYFDNLQISKLYSTEIKPNGYMFKPESNNAAVTVDNFGGVIKVVGGADAANGITVPAGITKTVQDGRLVLSSGDYVQTYTIETIEPTVTVENNTARVENSPNGVLIAAVYNSDNTLANVYIGTISEGSGEVTFASDEDRNVKVMGWSSLGEQKPLFDAQ